MKGPFFQKARCFPLNNPQPTTMPRAKLPQSVVYSRFTHQNSCLWVFFMVGLVWVGWLVGFLMENERKEFFPIHAAKV